MRTRFRVLLLLDVHVEANEVLRLAVHLDADLGVGEPLELRLLVARLRARQLTLRKKVRPMIGRLRARQLTQRKTVYGVIG